MSDSIARLSTVAYVDICGIDGISGTPSRLRFSKIFIASQLHIGSYTIFTRGLRKIVQDYRAFFANKILPILPDPPIFRRPHNRYLLQDDYYRTPPLSDHTFAEQDRLAQSGRHNLVSVNQRQQKTQVLLRAAEIIAECRSPFVAVGLERILKMRLF